MVCVYADVEEVEEVEEDEDRGCGLRCLVGEMGVLLSNLPVLSPLPPHTLTCWRPLRWCPLPCMRCWMATTQLTTSSGLSRQFRAGGSYRSSCF